MNLNERLNILRDSKQISEETSKSVINIIEMLYRDFKIVLLEENGAMFVTHLAIAVERNKKGEVYKGIDDNLFREIREGVWYELALKVLHKIEEEIGVQFPEEERTFIILHLCALFEYEK